MILIGHFRNLEMELKYFRKCRTKREIPWD